MYERVIHQHSKGKEKGPGKSKKGKWGPPIRQPYWEKPSGKGKSKDKGKGKGTPLLGLLIGLSRIRKECLSVVTTISRTNARASVAGPTIAQ